MGLFRILAFGKKIIIQTKTKTSTTIGSVMLFQRRNRPPPVQVVLLLLVFFIYFISGFLGSQVLKLAVEGFASATISHHVCRVLQLLAPPALRNRGGGSPYINPEELELFAIAPGASAEADGRMGSNPTHDES